MSDTPVTQATQPNTRDMIVNTLQILLANGKAQGIIRGFVQFFCGREAAVTDSNITRAVSLAMVAATLAWSWLAKHDAAAKIKAVERNAGAVLIANAQSLLTPKPLPTVAEIKGDIKP